jgi:hypothetical protein
MLSKLILAGLQLIIAVTKGTIEATPTLIGSLVKLGVVAIETLINAFKNTWEIGKNVVIRNMEWNKK